MKNFTLLIIFALLANVGNGQKVKVINPVINYAPNVTTTHKGGFYSKIPISQVSDYQFGLSLYNADSEEDATDSYVYTVTVKQGSDVVYNVSADAVTLIPSQDTVSLTLASLFTPDGSYLGWYTISFDVLDGSSESIYHKDWYFETTKDVYAHDSNEITQLNISPVAFINGGSNGDRINVVYDLIDTAEIAGMWVHVNEFTDPGVSIKGHIMRWMSDSPPQFFDDGSVSTSWNLNSPYYGDEITTEFFELEEEDIGNWVYLPYQVISNRYPNLVPNKYCVSLEVNYKGGKFSITRSVVNLDVHDDYVGYIMIQASKGIAILDDVTEPFLEPHVPMARMQLMREECKGFSDVLIQDTAIKMDEINLIQGSNATGWATVNIESPNGSETYTWTKRDDKSFSYTGDTLIAKTPGAYSVLITDAEGCINGTNIYMENNLAAAEYLADKATLKQNAPNPFADYTRISYEILKESNVQFVFSDALGAMVKTIDKGELAPGQYTLQLNASEFSNGVYYYSMVVDGQKMTRKMIVTK